MEKIIRDKAGDSFCVLDLTPIPTLIRVELDLIEIFANPTLKLTYLYLNPKTYTVVQIGDPTYKFINLNLKHLILEMKLLIRYIIVNF